MRTRLKVETIPLVSGLKIVSPFPALFAEEDSALAVTDTHIGIESAMESRGVHIPHSTLSTVLDSITNPARELGCKRVYLLGDMKHEFGRPRESDWLLVRQFIEGIRSVGAEPVLVGGNHDN